MSRTRLSLDDVHALSMAALTACGADKENAEAVTHFMWAAERDSCHSHGLFRLPGYAASLKSGKVNGKSRPTVEDLAPAAIRCNGDNGFAPMALKVGRDPLAERARETGIAALAITNTYHFSALWVEAAELAEMGLVAIAMTSAKPMVAPAGGTKALFGTNPLSFAWPRVNKPPMVFDMATAAMARGEIMVAAREGHTVHTRHARIGASKSIGVMQNVFAINLVIELIEAVSRFRLRLDVQLSLKGPDLFRRYQAHHQSPPPHHLQKHTRSQGPLLHRHYPASTLVRPCPTSAGTAV